MGNVVHLRLRVTGLPPNPTQPGVGEVRPLRRLFVLAATAALGVGAALGGPAHPAHADTGSTSGAGSPSPAAIVATAQQYLGYPYAYIGDDPSTGFSCIGFVHF